MTPAHGHDVFHWMVEIDKASTVMASEVGYLSPADATLTARAVQRVESEAAEPGAERPTDYLDIQPVLRAYAGTAPDDMHLGRSRQDILATVHRLCVRELVAEFVLPRTLALRAALLAAAEANLDVVVPAYTNGVQAQPTTAGHLLLGYEAAVSRSTARFLDAYPRLNAGPLGVAALATSSFPVDRERLADLLGFDGVEVNSFDAAQLAMTDIGFEAAACAMALALSLGTFVQDLHTQYHHVRPWFLLGGADLLSPSTLMPQKRNPVALNRARLLASEVLGDGVSTAFAAHNVASGLTDPKRAEAAATLARATDLLDAVTAVVRGLAVDAEAAYDQVHADYSVASELANALHRRGVAFADAHHFVSDLVTDARARRVGPDSLSRDDVIRVWAGFADTVFPLSDAEVRSALDPAQMVAAARGTGGPQPAELRRTLAAARDRLDADDDQVSGIRAALERAGSTRESAFTRLAAER